MTILNFEDCPNCLRPLDLEVKEGMPGWWVGVRCEDCVEWHRLTDWMTKDMAVAWLQGYTYALDE